MVFVNKSCDFVMINVAYYKQDGQTTVLCPSCLKDVVNVVFDGWLYSSITFLIKCYDGGLRFQIK